MQNAAILRMETRRKSKQDLATELARSKCKILQSFNGARSWYGGERGRLFFLFFCYGYHIIDIILDIIDRYVDR
jgi:hypothetical protein